jgi:hypothetical protein
VGEKSPFSSVVLVEFKRPARNDYKSDDNPIDQVLGYVREIRSGTTKDRNAVPIKVKENTPFYAYIVADITDTLKQQAENSNLVETPDEMGYFGYVAKLRTYIEIVSLDKLLDDAHKRNRFFFEQLFQGN